MYGSRTKKRFRYAPLLLPLVVTGHLGCESKLDVKTKTAATETVPPVVATVEVSEEFQLHINNEFQSSRSLTIAWDIPQPEAIASYSISLSKTADCKSSYRETAVIERTVSFDDLPDGDYFICATAETKTGNILLPKNNGIRLVIDTSAPALTFSTLAGASGVRQFTVTGTCETGVPLIVSGPGAEKAITGSCTAGAFSETFNFSTGVGLKTITIDQTDAAGNNTQLSRDFLRLKPQALVSGSPAKDSVVSTYAYSFAIAGTDVTAYKFALVPNVDDCSGASYSEAIDAAKALSGIIMNGAHKVCVIALDADGMIQTIATEYAWTSDTSNLALAISTPAGTAGVRHFTITGTCQTDLPLDVSGSGVESSFAGSCIAGAFSETFNFSAGAGAKTITISQTDAAGNLTQKSRDFLRILPTAFVSGSPASGSTVSTGAYSFAVSGSDVTDYKFALVNDPDDCAAASYGGTNAVADTLAGITADGQKKLCVIALDADGMIQTVASEYAWTMDSTVPVAVLGTKPSLVASSAAYSMPVSGASVDTYKYGIITGASADCSGVVYSSWIAATTPIAGTLTQRDARVCVLARSLALVVQSAPTTYFWQNTVYDAVPVVAHNLGMTLNEGASAVITTAMLQATDSDNTAAELQYTVVALPSQGQIRRDATALIVGETFTQTEIDGGHINYSHELRASAQTFTFAVRDPLGVGPASVNFSIGITAFCSGPVLALAPFAGGTGTPGDPYILCTNAQLNAIGANATYVSKNFRQYLDIDLAAPALTRISSSATPFSGSFNGRGYNLSNVTYGTSATTFNAVFASLNATAVLSNINITNATVTGRSNVGILAGKNLGSISNSTVSGSVNLTDAIAKTSLVGGAVGENQGTMSGVSANVTITVDGATITPEQIGGLVGYNKGTLSGCASAGSLVGTLITAESPGNAIDSYLGGLVGYSEGVITGSSSSVNVTLTRSGSYPLRAVGGLVGTVWRGGLVAGSFATGDVAGELGVGGLVGDLEGTVVNSYATGNVSTTATTAAGVGGLVGRNGSYERIALIVGSYASGDVSSAVAGGTRFGGLVGINFAGIEDSYATGSVSVGSQNNAGALVGYNFKDGAIVHSYSTGTVTAGSTGVGAMIGTNDGHLFDLFWDGELNLLVGMCGNGTGSGCTNSNNKTTSEMQTKATYTAASWDFAQTEGGTDTNGPYDNWTITPGNYPQQTWQWVGAGNTAPIQQLPTFAGGTGTIGDPYLIATPAQLASIGHRPQLMTVSFKLSNSLDMNGLLYEPIGHPGYPYSGTFDGNGYSIQNLSVTRYTPGAGLLGALKDGADVKNLTLVNPVIIGGSGVGPVSGLAIGTSSAGSIHLTSVVVDGGTVSALGAHVGGLAGNLIFATVDRSGSTAAVTLSGSPKRCNYAGGLVGFVAQSVVSKSYARGNVLSVSGTVGGFYGWGEGSSVTDSYATGSVTGTIINVAFPENGCVTVGSWAMVGGFGGTTYSDLGPASLTRVFATGAVNGGTGTVVGGLMGMVGIWGTWSMVDSFATGPVAGSTTTINGLIGIAYGRTTQDVSTYYASTGGTGQSFGGYPYGGSQYSANAGIDISGSGTPNYFFLSTNPPLSNWDFTPSTGVWVEQAGTYPKLAWEP